MNVNNTTKNIHVFIVPQDGIAMRLDRFLVQQMPAYSRTFFQKLIEHGNIAINNRTIVKASAQVKPSDTITVCLPSISPAVHECIIRDYLQVAVIFTHEHFLIIAKPAGLIVHAPHRLSTTITLVDWLKVHFSDVAHIGPEERPGIVHRLDKDTSGLLIIARTPQAHLIFSKLFKERCIYKTYLAVVEGHPPREGDIAFTISRHPVLKHKMTHAAPGGIGREALTHYRVIEYFSSAALMQVHPVTGRTHQIRVHCAGIGHSIIGDTVYGHPSAFINRQALHAYSLAFTFQEQNFEFKAPPPADFQQLLSTLRAMPEAA